MLAAVVAYHLEHEGISRVEKIRYLHLELLGVDLSEDALAELARQYSRLVKEAVIACSAVPGALDFLERFNAELPLFVVSGTPEEELLDIVKKRKMDKYFTAVHGSPRHKSPIVHELLQGQGLDADRCLFVGDAMTDYRAAKETGLSFIGRVGKGNRDPFPDGTTIIRDLKELSVYTFRPKGRD